MNRESYKPFLYMKKSTLNKNSKLPVSLPFPISLFLAFLFNLRTSKSKGWVANFGRWVAKFQGDGWWQRTCFLRELSGFESRHLSKIQNGRHKQRSGQHTLAPPKISKEKLEGSEHSPFLQKGISLEEEITENLLKHTTKGFQNCFFSLYLTVLLLSGSGERRGALKERKQRASSSGDFFSGNRNDKTVSIV